MKLLSAGVNIFSQQYCIDNTIYQALRPDDICAGIPDSNNDGMTEGGIDTCQVKLLILSRTLWEWPFDDIFK